MIRKLLFVAFIIFGLFGVNPVLAERDSLALTIIPPLMKMNMNPGESITTAIEIVNNNSEKIIVYAKVLDFKGKEEGGVEFIEDRESLKGTPLEKFFLSGWITINEGPIEISAFKSKNIPFLIKIPEDATPGGHYAAILVGTNPTEKTEGTVIKVSSYLSSLILINIAGEVEEKGSIREFSTDKLFYNEPKANFEVRFENSGNVHLQPTGNIKIYNIFGKEKGDIPINLKTDFGNVLPNNFRKWDFSWESDDDILIIDRFKAELSLSFGETAKQTDYREVNFWVVNVKVLSIILGIFLVILFSIVFFIKFYIRQSVKNIKEEFGVDEREVIKKPKKLEKLKASPVKKKARKVIDLRK